MIAEKIGEYRTVKEFLTKPGNFLCGRDPKTRKKGREKKIYGIFKKLSESLLPYTTLSQKLFNVIIIIVIIIIIQNFHIIIFTFWSLTHHKSPF